MFHVFYYNVRSYKQLACKISSFIFLSLKSQQENYQNLKVLFNPQNVIQIDRRNPII